MFVTESHARSHPHTQICTDAQAVTTHTHTRASRNRTHAKKQREEMKRGRGSARRTNTGGARDAQTHTHRDTPIAAVAKGVGKEEADIDADEQGGEEGVFRLAAQLTRRDSPAARHEQQRVDEYEVAHHLETPGRTYVCVDQCQVACTRMGVYVCRSTSSHE